jgi:2-hydroxychromene-2-carboxylate isomerase
MPKTNLQNHPPHLARSLRNIDSALIERIRRDSKQFRRQFDRATKFVLCLVRFALLSDQRLGSLEEMAGVGIGHDGGVDDDAMNAILVELKVKTEKKTSVEKNRSGNCRGVFFLSSFLSSAAVF